MPAVPKDSVGHSFAMPGTGHCRVMEEQLKVLQAGPKQVWVTLPDLHRKFLFPVLSFS